MRRSPALGAAERAGIRYHAGGAPVSRARSMKRAARAMALAKRIVPHHILGEGHHVSHPRAGEQ